MAGVSGSASAGGGAMCIAMSMWVSDATSSITAAYGFPDWLAGILMILGMIFVIAVIPLAVLFGICFECTRREKPRKSA
jgi:hypothetical protein